MLKPVIARLEALPGYQKLDGSDVREAVEQLIDEAVACESRPSAQQYLEFKSTQMAIDIARGGVYAADVQMKSAVSKALVQGVQGGGGLEVELQDKGGAPRVERYDHGDLTIGRVSGNDIVLARGNVSKRHTRIVRRDGKAFVVCLKATNGTFVNGRRISAPQVVDPDDQIVIGDFTLKVRPLPEP